MNRTEPRRLAEERLTDAEALLAAGRWAAAYYLAGYAVECALKACIAKRMKAEEFPDKKFAEKCWTHDLSQLLALADLKASLDAAIHAAPMLGANWDTVREWDESRRYAETTKAEAESLYAAITDATHRVLSRLKPQW